MRLIHLSLCCFFLFLVSCQDQSLISGQVFDSQKQPIDSVKILANGTDIFTYTNENGYFEINTNDLSDELLFDKVGYKLKFKTIKEKSTDLKVMLELKE